MPQFAIFSQFEVQVLVSNFQLKAPPGKFRVVGVDTFEGPTTDYLIGDFTSADEAIQSAKQHTGVMNPVYVYNDAGMLLFP